MAQYSGVFNLVTASQGVGVGNWPNSKAQSIQLLMVGAGGGGAAGGGGGGGFFSMNNLPVTPGTSYSVTVGAGGASASGTAGAGGNSTFGSNLTVLGGGGGQWRGQGSTTQGGSGGGGPADTSNSFPGGSYPGQGNPGGGDLQGYSAAPGGGGAGSAGDPVFRQFSNTGYNGQGGVGVHSLISGNLVSYGNGAAGAYSATNISGTAGTGDAATGTSATGGSGAVVVSYPDLNTAATTTGSVTASTSGSGSLIFNGTNYVYGPTTSALNFGTGNFTVEFWVYATSIGTLTELFSCSNATQDFQIGLSPTNYLYWHNSGNQITNAGTPASCPLNQWNHIVLVRSGTNCALFCNGVRYGTTTNSAAINLTNYYLGTYWNGAPNNYYLNGNLSNIRVSNTAIYSPTSSTLTVPTAPFTATSSTVLLMSTVSGAQFADSSASSLINSIYATASVYPTWNQASPFATGLGYKNRVYTFTGTGTITF